MRRFLTKVALLTSIIVVLFLALEFAITQGLKQSNSQTFMDWNKLYQGKINADVIINGSSKAMVHISPKILDSVLQVPSYNLGINGHDFYMQNAKYNAYETHNNAPKLIVQVVSNGTLQKREDLYQYEQFLPYLQDDSFLTTTTQAYIGLNFFDYHLPFVRYFGQRALMKEGVLNFLNLSESLPDSVKYKGYRPNDSEWDNSFELFVKYTPNGKEIALSDTSIQLFKHFIQKQQEKKVPIVLVYPPTYHESQQYINNRAEIIALYQKIAQQYNILFLDYSQLSINKEKRFFYNSQHLNQKGAEIFSRQLAKDLSTHFSF